MELSTQQKSDFLALIAKGYTTNRSLKELDLKAIDFNSTLLLDKKFSNDFDLHVKHGLKLLVHSAFDDIDNPDISVARTRLKLEHSRWLISRLMPNDYGDKIRVEVDVVDLSGALNEARSRIEHKPIEVIEIVDHDSHKIDKDHGPHKLNEDIPLNGANEAIAVPQDTSIGTQDPDIFD